MQQMLKPVIIESNYDNEAVILAKTTKIVRKEIIDHKSFHFDGKFSIGCQQTSVPSSLKMLISLLINGTSLKDQNVTESQASLTISQMIFFNFFFCLQSLVLNQL